MEVVRELQESAMKGGPAAVGWTLRCKNNKEIDEARFQEKDSSALLTDEQNGVPSRRRQFGRVKNSDTFSTEIHQFGACSRIVQLMRSGTRRARIASLRNTNCLTAQRK